MSWRVLNEARIVIDDSGRVGVITGPSGDVKVIEAVTDINESITELKDSITAMSKAYISLVSGDDVNAITTAGRYHSATGPITKAILNVPSVVGNNGFNLDVYSTANYPYYVQEITWCGYSSFVINKIVRCGRPVDGAYQWGAWHQYTLTVIETETTEE